MIYSVSILVAAAVFLLLLTASGRDVVKLVGSRVPSGARERVGEDLVRLGLALDPEYFLGLRVVISSAATVLGVILMPLNVLAGFSLFLFSLLLYVSFGKWLEAKERKRLNELKREFPVMVTLLRVYSRAGDLYQAMRIVREAVRGELKRQLDILASELEVYPLQRALDNLAARSRYGPLTNLVSVVLINVKTGMDVDDILVTFSRRAYEQRVNEIKRKIKARPIIMTVIPAVMMFTLLLVFVLPMYANIIDKLRAF
jgi:Flp pilus assembly protein TadB